MAEIKEKKRKKQKVKGEFSLSNAIQTIKAKCISTFFSLIQVFCIIIIFY